MDSTSTLGSEMGCSENYFILTLCLQESSVMIPYMEKASLHVAFAVFIESE